MSKRRNKGAPFVMLEKSTLAKPEWRTLTRPEKLIYLYIKANYNGSNNGDISFTYSSVIDQFSSATIASAIKGLEEKQWIERTRHGGMFRFYNKYKLTGKYDFLR